MHHLKHVNLPLSKLKLFQIKFKFLARKVKPCLRMTSKISEKLMLWDSSSTHSFSKSVGAVRTHTHHIYVNKLRPILSSSDNPWKISHKAQFTTFYFHFSSTTFLSNKVFCLSSSISFSNHPLLTASCSHGSVRPWKTWIFWKKVSCSATEGGRAAETFG